MIPQTVPCGTSFPLLPPASPSGFTFTGSGTRAGGKTCECFFTGKLLPYFMRKLRSVNGQEPTQRHSRTQSPAVVYLTCQGQAFSTFLYTVCFIEILQVLLSMLNIYKRTGHLYQFIKTGIKQTFMNLRSRVLSIPCVHLLNLTPIFLYFVSTITLPKKKLYHIYICFPKQYMVQFCLFLCFIKIFLCDSPMSLLIATPMSIAI